MKQQIILCAAIIGSCILLLPVAAASPTLSIDALQDGLVHLSWPADNPAFSLEEADQLAAPVQWRATSANVTNLAGRFSVSFHPQNKIRFYRLRGTAPATVIESSPTASEADVAVTRETIFHLSAPLAADALMTTENLFAEFGGRRLLSRVELSADHRTITLFYLENLPASAQVLVSLIGDGVHDAGGLDLDADRDGQPGGTQVLAFTTAGTSGLANTAITGHVFASEKNTDGSNRPLQGAIVTVDGAEESLRTSTDATGFFRLQPAPSGRFFVHVDGRTAIGSQWPGGAYYPFVGKAWEAIAGRTNNLAGGTGEIFLPLIQSGALQSVSATNETKITFVPSILATNPALAGVEVRVPPNTLFSDNGTRGGKVGIAPVPPDRLPEPLPPGLNLPLVITIQTDGPQNFDQPVPVRFPNLPDPVTGIKLGPGEKTALWSFNHDTGRWELQGPATITLDGNFAESDPGVGVRQPGWHGVAPGSAGDGAGELLPCSAGGLLAEGTSQCLPDNTCPPPEKADQIKGLCFDAEALCQARCWTTNRWGLSKLCGYIPGPNNKWLPNIPKKICSKLLGSSLNKCIDECLTAGINCKARLDDCIQHPHSKQIEGEALLAYQLAASAPTPAEKAVQTFSDLVRQHTTFIEALEAIAARAPAFDNLTPADQAEYVRIAQAMNSFLGGKTIDEFYQPALAALEDSMKGEEMDPRLQALPRGYYALVNTETGDVLRGRTGVAGEMSNIFLRPETLYRLYRVFPGTSAFSDVTFISAAAGQRTRIPMPVARPTTGLDADTDGLTDEQEFVIGTRPTLADTDGDGLLDGNEFHAGGNTLDGQPAASGVISSIDTPGTAVDVCAWNDLAAVADSSAGVALFDVANPLLPVLLSELKTQGRAVAAAGFGALLAVAEDTEGVALIDVSTPATPTFIAQHKVGQAARAVAIINGQIVVGLAGGEVVLLNDSGEILQRIAFDNTDVQDLLSLNGVLYVLKVGSIESFTVGPGTLTSSGKVPSPGLGTSLGRRLRLSGGGNRLLAAYREGYNVFDISAGLSPTLLSPVTTAQTGWTQIVPDGSGLALAIDGTSPLRSLNSLALYSIGLNVTGTNYITTFPTPGTATAVCFYRGLGLVADGTNGLSVVNYLSRDIGTNPPAVALRTRFRQGDQTAASGVRFGLIADAIDDRLVRNVEFYMNNQLVAVDGNYPFEIELTAPSPTQAQPQFTVRARAFDTAGNWAWSDALTIDLSKDLTPPTVVAFRPGLEERFLNGSEVPISARFSEAPLPQTLTDGFRLINYGPDGKRGTGDDSLVPASVLAIGAAEYVLQLTNILPLGSYAAVLRTNVTDLAGNPLNTEFAWEFRVQPLVEFIGVANLNWNSIGATSNNWSIGRLPTIDDFVHLAAPAGATVNASQVVSAFDLTTVTPLTVANNTIMHIGHHAIFIGPLSVHSSTWQGGGILFQGRTQLAETLGVTDENWVNEGNLTFGPNASINFRNSATDGITLENTSSAVWEMVDSQMTIGSLQFGPVDFENKGLLIARGTNRNTVVASRFINLGSVEVREGKLDLRVGDNLHGASQHLGTYRVDPGATLSFTGLSEFGRVTHIFGGGNVAFDAGGSLLFPGAYEIDGDTLVNGNVIFSGPVRSAGRWHIIGHSTFVGLNPELTGPVSVEERGTLTVGVLPEMRLNTLSVYSDLDISTALVVSDLLQLDSIVQPNGISAANCRLIGNGRLRANGLLTFAGIVNNVGQGIFEIGGSATFKPRAAFQFTGSSEIRVLAGGIFDVSGALSVATRLPIVNEGTLLKTDSSLIPISSGLQNRGLLRITAGTLQFGNLVESDGLISLAGGNLSIGGAFGPVALHLTGGKLEGTGTITCGSITNSAEISPGAAGSPLGVFDFQIGTHPVFSVYQQTAAGQLTIDIAGPAPGAGYDQITTTGRALLNGKLQINPDPNYDPPVGQEFTILQCGTREGTFAEILGVNLPGGKRFEISYEAASVKLHVAQ